MAVMSSLDASTLEGLTSAEVAARVTRGQVNVRTGGSGRSVAAIVRANVLTRINAMLAGLFILVLLTGSLVNGLFGLLIVFNSGIGIFQEVRAKRTLERLSIVGEARPWVRRDGGREQIPGHELVVDDVIELGPGDQLLVDGVVLDAAALDVDESLLTGESDAIDKHAGDELRSGSFVVAGSGVYRATAVGEDAYAAQLATQAGQFTLVDSQLRSGINLILRGITYVLVPAGVLTMANQLLIAGDDWRQAILGMVGALVPMVPEGLVLLTTVAFAVGVVRLGRRQCLVNELPAIEGLARVDVVCADKTGTLTEPGMRLAEVVALADMTEPQIGQALAALAAADPHPNASIEAIADAYPQPPGWSSAAIAPFNSASKWSGVSFADHGNWLLGAPDVLLDPAGADAARATELGSTGLRVLLAAESDRAVDATDAPGQVTPVALIALEQRVRPDAADTIEYFAAQDVAVKVISGDNAVSVGAVAASLGLGSPTTSVDARDLPEDRHALADALEESVTFGRVRPDQKRAMVQALKSRGHTVAMTGDGVNDVLALKDADIGVAMGSGSPATRAVAQIVLLDNRFATLPHVVAEGRRVIGNIERVSRLYLTKTIYAVTLAFLIGTAGLIAKAAHLTPISYPFQPIHATIAGWFTIGVPSFVLALAPDAQRAQPGFVRRVLRLAIPSGIIVALCTLGCYLIVRPGANSGITLGGGTQHHLPATALQASTAALVTMIGVSLWVLVVTARPLVPWKIALLAFCYLAYVPIFALQWTRKEFLLDPTDKSSMLVAAAFAVLGMILVELVHQILRRRAQSGASAG